MMYGRGGQSRFQSPTPVRGMKADIKRVLPWVLPYAHIVLLGLICMAISTYLGIQPPRIVRYVVDEVIGKNHYEQTGPLVLLTIGLFLGIAIFNFLRTYWMHISGQRLLHTLRTTLYAHFQKLPLTYYDSRQTGDLMSRTTSDVEQVEQLLEHGMDILLMGIFGMGLTYFYMWDISPKLSLLVLLPIPLIAVSIYFFSHTIRGIYRSIRDRIGDLNAKLQDNLSGIRVIKAFSRETIEQELITRDSAAVMGMNIRAIRLWSSFGPYMGFVSNLGLVIVLWQGIPLARQHLITPGALTAFWLYIMSFYQPIRDLFQFFDSLQRSLAASDRLFEVLDTVPDIQDPNKPQQLACIQGEIEFRHVSFRYETGEEVLHDVNLVAHPGETIALVGRSGAGKSSFINLIPRFYDVREGTVLVDGVDVRLVRQADLRKHIALVLQETFLFNGTVRDNLRYGKMDATEEEILAASQAANAHEFIERLPKGYDTEIGERGVKLSGGQRQRLSIARAVLVDPRILILDEATSSVDSESEYLIHQALERLMEGRTTFIIAHRLSTIKHADSILVLDDGQIVEHGNHAKLIQKDKVYAQMYRQQFWLDELLQDEQTDDMKKVAPADAEIELPSMS